MRTRPPRPRKTYDRHWAYPNPAGPVRRLLGDSKAGRDLCRRIAGGDPHRVRDWMRRHEGPFELFNLLQLGLGGVVPAEQPLLLFDEVAVASLVYSDRPRTTYSLFARRARPGVAYRVWSHTAEAWAHTLARPAPLTRPEVRRLFRHSPWAAGPAGVEADVVFYARGPEAWDPAGPPNRLGGWDGDLEVGCDTPAPCPACGSDLNNGDTCVHLMSTWTMPEGHGDWAGRYETLEDLRDAYTELEEAVGWMSKTGQGRLLRAVLPARLWRAMTGYFRGPRRVPPDDTSYRSWGLEDWGLDGLQDYLSDQLFASPTSLGGDGMGAHDDHSWESWTVSWDTMAATRARELDRRFAADARALRRAARRADRLF